MSTTLKDLENAGLLEALRAYHAGADRGELKALLCEAWGPSPADQPPSGVKNWWEARDRETAIAPSLCIRGCGGVVRVPGATCGTGYSECRREKMRLADLEAGPCCNFHAPLGGLTWCIRGRAGSW